MRHIPTENPLKTAATFLRNGYPFVQKSMERHHSNIFKIKIPGLDVLCIHGEDAARIFYNQDLFERQDAIPKRVQKTLLGENGIHTLDDETHRHRKAMFMALMAPVHNIQHLMDLMGRYWQAYVAKWEKMEEVSLFEDAQEVLCLAACDWAGVPLKPEEVRQRARDYCAMVDAFGAVGPRHWRGRSARQRTEEWIGGIVEQIRNGTLKVPEGSPAHTIAWHRDLTGKQLDIHMASVELINVIRPIVAIAYYISFVGLAIHDHPELKPKLQADEGDYVEMFVHEVRRYYPFTPILGAKVRRDFEWKGYQLKKGALVILDVHGIDHDQELWKDADTFNPERFRNWQGSPYDFIPQGGGDYMSGHRCPGEWITIEAMKLAARYLVNYINYQVPEQNLNYNLVRMPTFPKSRFIISMVKRTGKPAPVATAPKCPYHGSFVA